MNEEKFRSPMIICKDCLLNCKFNGNAYIECPGTEIAALVYAFMDGECCGTCRHGRDDQVCTKYGFVTPSDHWCMSWEA